MEAHQGDAFSSSASMQAERDRVRLAAVRNLARLYRDVLHEPLPPALHHLVERLEQRMQGADPTSFTPARAPCAGASPAE